MTFVISILYYIRLVYIMYMYNITISTVDGVGVGNKTKKLYKKFKKHHTEGRAYDPGR